MTRAQVACGLNVAGLSRASVRSYGFTHRAGALARLVDLAESDARSGRFLAERFLPRCTEEVLASVVAA